MSLDVKLHGDKWRLGLTNEEWEFDSEEDLHEVMKALMGYKKKYGKITNVQD
jgi:hypothetical protein